MPSYEKIGASPEMVEQQYWPRYHFSDIHRKEWVRFWTSIEGDLEKCQQFAREGGLYDPTQWCASLYKFLFSVWPGEQGLLLKGAKQAKTLQEYVSYVYSTHKENPRDRGFYMKLGVTPEQFLQTLEGAKEQEYEYDIIQYVNARIPAYGDRLLEEYALQFHDIEAIQELTASLRKLASAVREEARKRELDLEVSVSDLN